MAGIAVVLPYRVAVKREVLSLGAACVTLMLGGGESCRGTRLVTVLRTQIRSPLMFRVLVTDQLSAAGLRLLEENSELQTDVRSGTERR